MHFVIDCTFLNHVCSQCHTAEQKASFCSSAKLRLGPKRPSRHDHHIQKQKSRADAIFRISNIDCNRYRRNMESHGQAETRIPFPHHTKRFRRPHPSPRPTQMRLEFQGRFSRKDDLRANTLQNLRGAVRISKVVLYSFIDPLPTIDLGPTDPTPTMSSVLTSNDLKNGRDDIQRHLCDPPLQTFRSTPSAKAQSQACLPLKPPGAICGPRSGGVGAPSIRVDVILKVNCSNWAAPIVIVKKSSSSPYCAVEDIFKTLSRGRYFSHIDIPPIPPDPTANEDHVIAAISVSSDIEHVFANLVRALPVTAEDINQMTQKDQLLQPVMKYTR
uniref:Uncharacterized protein n=1 Tax=Heligmosomoides polygyrus TaxID=6339 RepID=A0A183FW87_HELPZ